MCSPFSWLLAVGGCGRLPAGAAKSRIDVDHRRDILSTNANRPKRFGSALLGCAHHMLSIRRTILLAAGLMLAGSLQSFSAAPAVLPLPVRQASADELRIRGHHNRASELRSVAQHQTTSDIAAGAPYSSATTPTVGSPEWKRDAAETARKEKELARKLNGICRGC